MTRRCDAIVVDVDVGGLDHRAWRLPHGALARLRVCMRHGKTDARRMSMSFQRSTPRHVRAQRC